MKITNATIQNFLTISQAEMHLDDRGLLLITGQNDDDTSANSNGAGKSSLVDAICWALFGSTARDVTADDVINETAKKDCLVSLTIEDDGSKYEVVRHRKHKTNKNALLVYKYDISGGKTDISKGTDKETQLVVSAIVGCSAEVFTSAVYAGQERMPDLPSMTDKPLKMLIEEAAGIQVLEKANSIARKTLDDAKALHSEALHKVSLVDNAIAVNAASLASIKIKFDEFDATKRDRAREHLKLCIPHMTTLKSCDEKMAAYKAADYSSEAKVLLEKLAELEEIKTKNVTVVAAFDETNKKWRSLVDEYYGEERQIDRIQSEVKNSEALIGKPCGECGKEYCATDLAGAIKARQELIEKRKAEQDKVKAEAQRLEAQVSKLDKARKDLDEQLLELPKIQARLTEIKQAQASIKLVEERKQIADEAIANIKNEANAKLKEKNPFVSHIQDLLDKEAKLNVAKKDKEAAANKLLEKVNLANMAVSVFGPAGVRAHILDTVTPFLNTRTSEYLGALSDGNIHAVWTTLATTAKGEVKEKFSITVANDSGGSSFKKLSGGEKRKVRLATSLALQDLVMSRATKPIDLWIADEIDYALDDSGLERLMGVLERKARERGTVLIISHQSGLRDWVDQTIDVVKKGKISTVSGDNLKMSA